MVQKKKTRQLYDVKNVTIRIFLWSAFSRIRNEHGYLLFKSPYSVGIREKTDREKLFIRKIST